MYKQINIDAMENSEINYPVDPFQRAHEYHTLWDRTSPTAAEFIAAVPAEITEGCYSLLYTLGTEIIRQFETLSANGNSTLTLEQQRMIELMQNGLHNYEHGRLMEPYALLGNRAWLECDPETLRLFMWMEFSTLNKELEQMLFYRAAGSNHYTDPKELEKLKQYLGKGKARHEVVLRIKSEISRVDPGLNLRDFQPLHLELSCNLKNVPPVYIYFCPKECVGQRFHFQNAHMIDPHAKVTHHPQRITIEERDAKLQSIWPAIITIPQTKISKMWRTRQNICFDGTDYALYFFNPHKDVRKYDGPMEATISDF